jgi:replicative DNA helicase
MTNSSNNGASTLQSPESVGPSNIDAERSVLGSILLDPGVLPDVMQEITSPEQFSLPAHQFIFVAILALAAEARVPDLTTLSAELRRAGQLDAVGGYMALANLEMCVVATGAAAEHARLVRTAHQHRQILRTCRSAAIEAKQAAREPREIVEAACRDFMGLVESGNGRGRYTAMGELMEVGVEGATMAAHRRRRNEVLGVPWGLRDLDGITGGLQPGELTILAARPSIGKTSLAIHAYRHIIKTLRRPVVFFSLEMGNEPIANRIICSEAGLDSDRIRKGFASDGELARHRSAANSLSQLPGMVRDCSQLSGVDLLMQVRLLKAQIPDLALVVVDGLWLMEHPQGRGLNYATMVGETSRLVKRAAKESGVPILLVHQLSRNNEMRAGNRDRRAGRGDRPTLSDLRDSGAVEQDADLVIFVYRERQDEENNGQCRPEEDDDEGNYRRGPAMARPPQEDPARVPTELIVAKHRNGPIGTARVIFETSTQRWLDAARVMN